MRSLCGAPRQRAPALGWHIRWGLHIDLACTKRQRLWILLREEGAFGAHTLTLPSLWQGRAGGQHGHIGHGTTSFFVAFVEDKGRAGAVDAPHPSRRSRPAVRATHARCCIACLYEVSSRGMDPARSHTAGWRYSVSTSCICPC